MRLWQVNGFKPKTRAQFDASEVLKKLQELLQLQHLFSDRCSLRFQQEMQKPPGKHIDVPMAVKLEKPVAQLLKRRSIHFTYGFSL